MMLEEKEVHRIISSGKIVSKEEFYLLYNQGLLGNRLICWSTYDEILKSGWGNPVCIRPKGLNARGKTKYNIPLIDVRKEIDDLVSKGIKEKDITFNQSAPDDKLILQGELTKNHLGFCLHYSTVKKPMALALKEEQKNISGLKAKTLLESIMLPQSFADIENLLELFPDAIIEFGVYSEIIGNLPGRNTIIWEVRDY